MKSLVAGGMHYIRSGDGSEELYALRSDPEERLNVAGHRRKPGSIPRTGFEAALSVDAPTSVARAGLGRDGFVGFTSGRRGERSGVRRSGRRA